MALRNFWVEVEIDGRTTKLTGGPQSKNGKMTVRVYQRNRGESVRSATVECEPAQGDMLMTSITLKSGDNDMPRQTYFSHR